MGRFGKVGEPSHNPPSYIFTITIRIFNLSKAFLGKPFTFSFKAKYKMGGLGGLGGFF
jgi:hypothetical protein